MKDKDSVYDVGAPWRIGIIVKAGAEVSEVEWPSGRREYITNDYLRLSKVKFERKAE